MNELTDRDRRRLEGVHPKLVETVVAAYDISPLRLMVIEGLRTPEKQREYVANGASRTMNSRHLTGHAVDLGVLDGVELSWHWPLYYQLADVMRQAAEHVTTILTWGGVWDRDMPQYTHAIVEEVGLYHTRWRRANPGDSSGPLIDGPHFELSRRVYK